MALPFRIISQPDDFMNAQGRTDAFSGSRFWFAVSGEGKEVIEWGSCLYKNILPSGAPGSYTATRWGMANDLLISVLTTILRQMP
jgi:hypothetical protein